MNTLKSARFGIINKLVPQATMLVFGAMLSIPSWGIDQAYQSWVMGNNAASFTYTGSKNLATGTVFTLSTAGNSLGFCTLIPNSEKDTTQYSTSCFSNYGTILGNGDSYSAVAFLGAANNPSASFIVGDSAGNLSIATPDFGPNYQVTGLTMTPLPGCPSGTSVANLQADPSGNYVYIGCYNPAANPISILAPTNKNVYTLPGYTLYSAQLTKNGNNVSIGNYVLQGGGGIFAVAGNSPQAINQVAAVWPGVSSVMRTYPAQYPGLQNTNYSSTGAVLVSGLVDFVEGGTGTASTGPLGIENLSLFCSNGACSPATKIGAGLPANPSQIITALEIGMDNYGNGLVPAIYTSSYIGNNNLWYCANPNPVDGGCYSYEGTIYWQDVSPTINSCSIYYGAGTDQGLFCSSPASSTQNLIWPPNGMPTPGKGYQIDITNLTYVSLSSTASNTSSFTQGLLLIGTWTNGYLAYHSPADINDSTGLFLNQENYGNIGNVNSITADANGNLLFQTGSQGLYAMNPFVGTNTATGTDSTLIQQPANSSSSSGSGLATILKNGAKFIYNTVETIASLAGVASTAEVKPASKDDDTAIDQSIEDGLTPRFSLTGPFNEKKYHGQFVFTQSQLESMGLNPGEAIQGLRFRNAEGLKASPIEDVKMNKLKVTLSEGPSAQANIELKPSFSANLGKNRKTVKNGEWKLYKDGLPGTAIHPDQSVGTGIYGQLIPFRKEYNYKGGNLLVDIESSGKTYSFPVAVDAFGTKSAQGLYQTPKTKRPVKLRSVPAISFVK